jgi:tetratricopeptide (TPR) repeat protein
MEAMNLQQGAAALDLLQQAYRLAPRERDIRYWLGNALRLCGRMVEAERMLRGLMKDHPADGESGFALAYLLRAQGRPAESAKTLLQLARTCPGDLQTLLKVTGFLRDANCFEEAIEVLRWHWTSLQMTPTCTSNWLDYSGHRAFPEALSNLRLALDRNPRLGGAWLGLAQLQAVTDTASPDWQRIEWAGGQNLGEEAGMCLAFARGKGLDDLGEWQSAWNEFTRGNRLRRATQTWNRQAWQQFVSATLRSPAPRGPADKQAARRPVYIVGMLRSGTTLLEQLLGRHPLITGRGELNVLPHLAANSPGMGQLSPARRRAFGDELWTQLRLDGPAHHHYIDKNPLNFRFLGFLLDVLPETKVIHVSRDGRDSCLSCHFQLFQHPDAAFANDLEDLLDYYRGYRQLMAHWTASAGDRIHAVKYHELVNSPRKTLDDALGFLNWNGMRQWIPTARNCAR